MEFLSTQFLSALLAIVVIDLMLAGDNAIVIALAARNLPPQLQRRAVIWGTVGAIVVRSAMTMIVVWLLKIPGLLFVGGALLIWIAYRLLAPADEGGDAHGPAAQTFWGAMRTIVVADAIMGLDNVLAVAGAAHGSYVLVVLGLLISIPIVIWGSTLILRWVERYPSIVYLGAGVLAWTAVKMMTHEPLTQELFAMHPLVVPLTYVLVVGGILWIGFRRNHRHLQSRIDSQLAARQAAAAGGPVAATAEPPAAAEPVGVPVDVPVAAARTAVEAAAVPAAPNPSPAEPVDVLSATGESTMKRILVPVDTSRNAEAALRHVVNKSLNEGPIEVHVLNVQPPFSRHIAKMASRRNREGWHRDEADKALAPARALLDQHGVAHATHYKVGEKAKTIVDEARRLRCDQIVMGTARKSSLTRMLEDSTTNKVLEQTTVPLELIAGTSVSMLERWGLPAGVGALIALVLMSAD